MISTCVRARGWMSRKASDLLVAIEHVGRHLAGKDAFEESRHPDKYSDNGGMRTTVDRLHSLLERELAPPGWWPARSPCLPGRRATRFAPRRASAVSSNARSSSSIATRPGSEIAQSAQALSLFSSQRIVEIRMPGGKPGQGAASADAARRGERAGTAGARGRGKARSRRARQRLGQRHRIARVHVAADPVTPEQFPRWLGQRASGWASRWTRARWPCWRSSPKATCSPPTRRSASCCSVGRAQADEAAVLESVSATTASTSRV